MQQRSIKLFYIDKTEWVRRTQAVPLEIRLRGQVVCLLVSPHHITDQSLGLFQYNQGPASHAANNGSCSHVGFKSVGKKMCWAAFGLLSHLATHVCPANVIELIQEMTFTPKNYYLNH